MAPAAEERGLMTSIIRGVAILFRVRRGRNAWGGRVCAE